MFPHSYPRIELHSRLGARARLLPRPERPYHVLTAGAAPPGSAVPPCCTSTHFNCAGTPFTCMPEDRVYWWPSSPVVHGSAGGWQAVRKLRGLLQAGPAWEAGAGGVHEGAPCCLPTILHPVCLQPAAAGTHRHQASTSTGLPCTHRHGAGAPHRRGPPAGGPPRRPGSRRAR